MAALNFAYDIYSADTGQQQYAMRSSGFDEDQIRDLVTGIEAANDQCMAEVFLRCDNAQTRLLVRAPGARDKTGRRTYRQLFACMDAGFDFTSELASLVLGLESVRESNVVIQDYNTAQLACEDLTPTTLPQGTVRSSSSEELARAVSRIACALTARSSLHLIILPMSTNTNEQVLALEEFESSLPFRESEALQSARAIEDPTVRRVFASSRWMGIDRHAKGGRFVGGIRRLFEPPAEDPAIAMSIGALKLARTGIPHLYRTAVNDFWGYWLLYTKFRGLEGGQRLFEDVLACTLTGHPTAVLDGIAAFGEWLGVEPDSPESAVFGPFETAILKATVHGRRSGEPVFSPKISSVPLARDPASGR